MSPAVCYLFYCKLQLLKVAFFQKVWFVFQISKFPKNYPELEIWISRQLQYTVIGGKLKFQVQDSFLEYFFSFGDLEI